MIIDIIIIFRSHEIKLSLRLSVAVNCVNALQVLRGIFISELLAPRQHKKLFIGVKTNIVSANRRNNMAELLSAFLFVSCPYVLNAQRLGEMFFQLGFVSHDSLYLNVTPPETLSTDDKFDCSFAWVQNKLCISFNLAETHCAEKLLCEQLLSSIYNKTGELVSNIHFSEVSTEQT